MSVKQSEVLEWLAETVDGSEIPSFERSDSNIDKLYNLRTLYKEAFEDVNHVNDYIKNKSDSHENYYKQISDNLKDLGISSNFLGDEGQKCLNALGDLYCHLHLQSALPSNVMLAINAVETENNEVEECLRKEKQYTEKLLKLSMTIGQNLDEIKRISKEAECTFADQEQELGKEKKKIQFNEEKYEGYCADANSFQTKLDEAGYEDSISLSSISKQVSELSLKKKNLEEKKKILDSYTLPPDMALAEIKVEEMRQILAEKMKLMTQAKVNQN